MLLSRPARLSAAALAALLAGSLAIQPTLGEGSYAANFAGLFRYFTIWSNAAALVVMALVAIGRTAGRAVLASLVTALTVVGAVYWGLLASEHQPVGIDRLTNQVYHTIVPLAVVAWWFAFASPSERIAPHLPAVMAPPLVYAVFAFVVGRLTGFYPYFFSNQPELGWGPFLLANTALAVFFAGVGAVLLALQGAVHRRRTASVA